MVWRALATGLLIVWPTRTFAKTISLVCEVEQSSAKPESSQRPNLAVGEIYTFTFNTEGGQGFVERHGRGSYGKAVVERWSPQVNMTPTHAIFVFQDQLSTNTVVSHDYRIDRASLKFTGSIDAFGEIKFLVAGSCQQVKTQQRSNRF